MHEWIENMRWICAVQRFTEHYLHPENKDAVFVPSRPEEQKHLSIHRALIWTAWSTSFMLCSLILTISTVTVTQGCRGNMLDCCFGNQRAEKICFHKAEKVMRQKSICIVSLSLSPVCVQLVRPVKTQMVRLKATVVQWSTKRRINRCEWKSAALHISSLYCRYITSHRNNLLQCQFVLVTLWVFSNKVRIFQEKRVTGLFFGKKLEIMRLLFLIL